MTAIQWTDKTWNPTTGCTKISAGCRNCYAETIANRFWGDRSFSDVQFHPDRLEEPLRWQKPQMVFVDSMSDLFHSLVADFDIRQVFRVMERCPQHIFQILTKRPERMQQFVSELYAQWGKDPLPNVWLGVSCEDQKAAMERIPILLQVPAQVRFLSVEPILEFINLEQWLWQQTTVTWGAGADDWDYDFEPTDRLHWVVVGGESGNKARPCRVEWIESIVQQCQEAQVPVFVKQLGSKPFVASDNRVSAVELRDRKGGDLMEWSEHLRIREFPEVA